MRSAITGVRILERAVDQEQLRVGRVFAHFIDHGATLGSSSIVSMPTVSDSLPGRGFLRATSTY